MPAPLIIAGVRIAAPIAAKYLAGKLSKKGALKAAEKRTLRAEKIDRKIKEKGVEEAAKKIKKKTIAEEMEALKQTAVGKNMTTKQLKDRVRIDREHAKKRKSPEKRETSQSSPNPKKAKKRTFKTYNKRFTARPRGYLSPRGEPLGGMKKGGRVGGKCKVDGIATRGRTKAKR